MRFAVALAASLALAACSKRNDIGVKARPARVPTSTVGSDGLRRVTVDVFADGYNPSRITGRPGEKLVLVFTRMVEDGCVAQLKTPDGKLVALPLNTPVEVAVTVPQAGEVGFACGMDMMHGAVVAKPET
jgi:plastocyanin domain-containing protein